MTRFSNERAVWVTRHVLPHEADLRRWLGKRRLVGLDVDDIVQETYAKVSALDSVEAITNPKAYLFRAAYSLMVSHIRRAKIVAFEMVADVEEVGAETDAPSPERQVADRDELQHLARCIGRLPPKIREVFVLRKVEGLNQRDVSQRLGIPESTIEKRMARAAQLLAEIYSRGGYDPREASKPSDAKSKRREE